ncbi:MAG: FlgD immunoglobulin-like domain containing protein [Solirubrobacteraceae bacterium]
MGPALIVLAVILAALVATPSANADPAGPFATITGSVPAGSNMNFSALPLATGHTNVVVRITVSGGEANFSSPGSPYFDNFPSLYSGDVSWEGLQGSFAPGDTPQIQVEALGNTTQSVSFSAEFFDEPRAPASYSGSSSAQSDESDLHFSVPGAATYVADVSLSGGAITLSGGLNSQTFDSSGEYPLGQKTPGDNFVAIKPVQGPASQWTITIRALPVTVYDVSFDDADVQPGVIDTLSYSTTGTTTTSTVVTNATGTVVRSLASDFGVQMGSHTLIWDGRDASGNPVPTGIYTATIASTDPFGNIASGQTRIVVDSTPPLITPASTSLSLSQALVVEFADTFSGVASGSLTTPTGGKVSLGHGQNTLSYVPSGGWQPGHYELTAAATDKAGNKAVKMLSITVRSPARRTRGPALPKVPIGYGKPQFKPYFLTTTGDGSGYYGGRTGQKVTGGPHHRANFGHLAWMHYTATNAYATGVEWAKFGPGPLSIDRFKIFGTVALHAYRPRSGVFTRLEVSGTYAGHHFHGISDARYSEGSWYW